VITLDIGSLPQGHTHQEIEAAASEVDLEIEGGRPVSPVRISLDITRSGEEISVTGLAVVSVVYECARCLEDCRSTVEAPLGLVVLVGDRASGEEEQDGLLRVSAGASSADLTDEIRGGLLLRLPLKPLCREDCKGLCPGCGANLNQGKCGCRGEEGDSRWGALKDLKVDK